MTSFNETFLVKITSAPTPFYAEIEVTADEDCQLQHFEVRPWLSEMDVSVRFEMPNLLARLYRHRLGGMLGLSGDFPDLRESWRNPNTWQTHDLALSVGVDAV